MAKTKRKKSSPSIPNVIARHGHQHQYFRGDIKVNHRATHQNEDKIETLSRSYRVCRYNTLHKRHAIDDAQREAADKYLVLTEASLGAKVSEKNSFIDKATVNTSSPTFNQIVATSALRDAHHAVGKHAQYILTMLIIDNHDPKSIGNRLHVSDEKAMGLIIAALQRLAEHWRIAEVWTDENQVVDDDLPDKGFARRFERKKAAVVASDSPIPDFPA